MSILSYDQSALTMSSRKSQTFFLKRKYKGKMSFKSSLVSFKNVAPSTLLSVMQSDMKLAK